MSKKAIVNLAVAIIVIAFVFNAGDIGRYTFVAIISYIAVRLAIYAVRYYRRYRSNKGSSRKERLLKVLACVMGVFFISGTVIYIFTFPWIGKDHGVQFNNAELIIRSMICSLDMFMLDVDSNILDRLDDHSFLKGMIVCQAALSFVCTVTLLISLVYSRAKAFYDLHRRTRITDAKNHLYVFFGANENSKLLAKDVHERDDRSVIVFVDHAEVNDDENDSWDNIVNLFTHRQKTFDLAGESKALVAISSTGLSEVEEDWLEREASDVFAMIGIDKIRDLIRDLVGFPKESQLHIFFLSDDEDENIRSLLNLAKDSTILSMAEETGVEHHIYCHARFNGPNRIVEDLAVRKHLNVEIVDSSHLAVELMKSSPEDQPVRTAWLSGKYPTMVECPLECLIVGFGEVGRDSFRFLYEFGTFMRMKDGKPSEAKPRITAVDSKMKKIEGLFRVHKPALEAAFEKGDLSLLNLDWHEQEFFSRCLSPERCRKLNYIVIALGDDDQNISLAATIFQIIRRYREDMSHLRIMVRCVRYEKMEIMRKVAAHYNIGGKMDHDVLCLFGNPEKIYSYDTVIKADLTKRGKTYYYNYARLRGEKVDWDKRHRDLTAVTISESGEPGYPDLDNLRRLRRQENQDMADALHASTKIWLMREALGMECDWNDFISRFFDIDGSPMKNGSKEEIFYHELSVEENRILLHLAMLEHARWNSAHELLGYMVNENDHRCEERTQLHNCIRPWEELDEESEKSSSPGWECDYKAYDFSVVDTSLYLSEKIKNQKT
ncbi:MAG: hypothetical protein K2L11_06365 [Muribaculaceae bacterium]|nr:hypothetical protein [Muribaculaceae bacterium]